MKELKTIERFISRLLFIGLILGLIFIYFEQERLYSGLVNNDLSLGSEKYIRIASVLLIFATVLMALFKSKSMYHTSIYLAYFTLVTYISLVYVLYGADIFDTTQFMDKKGLGPWICLGLIFVSYDNKRYKNFQDFLLLATIVLFVYTIYNLVDFGVGAYRGQAMTKYRVYAVNAMWILPYVYLSLKSHKFFSKYRFIVLFFGICLALIVQTRSFLLLYFIVLLFDFYYAKKKLVYIIASSVLAVLFVVFLFSSESLSSSYELLGQRGLKETRVGQLSQFFEQVNFFELIVGKGPYASWHYSNGFEFQHLDNQWVLLLWWAGLIPFLMYLYLTAYISLKMFFRPTDYQTKVEAFIIILWVLACAGLAIYSTMSVSFYFFVICIIQGRLLHKYSMIS